MKIEIHRQIQTISGIKPINMALTLFLLLFSMNCLAGPRPPKKYPEKIFRVGFYNVENLFDWEDDPLTDDQQFLSNGDYGWTKERFELKISHLAKVIRKISPDVMGVCEVENRKVLDYLITKTVLKKDGYSLVHYDSHDKRGIDVGLIYKKGRINVMKTASYPVVFPGDMSKPSRDILYVKGRTAAGQELHFLVNHWPSRSGGKEKTEHKRMLAAKTARRLCDSILFSDKDARVVLMGDFNDYPNDKSLTEGLGAQVDSTASGHQFYNLMGWQSTNNTGSYNYKGQWGFLDQFVVSSSLIKGNGGIQAFFKNTGVADFRFIFTKVKKGQIPLPFSTYNHEGKYIGGYSDHLPVYTDFYFNQGKP
ncbi:MAG: endonuclease [Bacteroidia bacterium]|nr:endonuclease [Bacteroidia bacterium]